MTKKSRKPSGLETPLRKNLGRILSLYFILNFIEMGVAGMSDVSLTTIRIVLLLHVFVIFWMFRYAIQYLKHYSERGLAITTIIFASLWIVVNLVIFLLPFIFPSYYGFYPEVDCPQYCEGFNGTVNWNLTESGITEPYWICACYNENGKPVGQTARYKMTEEGGWTRTVLTVLNPAINY